MIDRVAISTNDSTDKELKVQEKEENKYFWKDALKLGEENQNDSLQSIATPNADFYPKLLEIPSNDTNSINLEQAEPPLLRKGMIIFNAKQKSKSAKNEECDTTSPMNEKIGTKIR